jgi:hypothetical protein
MFTVPGEPLSCRSLDHELVAPPPSERVLAEREAGKASSLVNTLHFIKCTQFFEAICEILRLGNKAHSLTNDLSS